MEFDHVGIAVKNIEEYFHSMLQPVLGINELSEIFRKIICDKNVLKLKNWNAYSDAFNPIVVMNKFKKVFIDS